jgi:hypothetical protein
VLIWSRDAGRESAHVRLDAFAGGCILRFTGGSSLTARAAEGRRATGRAATPEDGEIAS